MCEGQRGTVGLGDQEGVEGDGGREGAREGDWHIVGAAMVPVLVSMQGRLARTKPPPSGWAFLGPSVAFREASAGLSPGPSHAVAVAG